LGTGRLTKVIFWFRPKAKKAQKIFKDGSKEGD